MKVMLVNGSPHPKGSISAILLEIEKTLNGLGIETGHFWIGAKPIGGCIGCSKCAGKGVCIFGGQVNDFLETAADYDGFIFGSPVHWAATCGNMKSFMDRVFFADFMGGKSKLRLKPGACVAAARRGGIETTTDQMLRYFSASQMPIVTSRYWNGAHGLDAADLPNDEEGMQVMRILAKNMAWMLRCLEAGREKGVPLPDQEEISFTNFVRK